MMPTPVADGFEWRDDAAGRVLVSKALSGLASHVFTTRGTDDSRLPAALGVDEGSIASARQVHGRAVVVLRQGEPVEPGVTADALVSTDPLRAVAVYVADCVPILIADRGHRVVAAVHAGWRGTSANVVGAAVGAIAAVGIPPADLVAAVGPSIGPCCYQVDQPVRDVFDLSLRQQPFGSGWFTEDGPDHWKLDLWRANADALAAAGVLPANIHVATFCTRDHPAECFSYRRDGARTGRMTAAIALRRSG